jgi:hypothetical protein
MNGEYRYSDMLYDESVLLTYKVRYDSDFSEELRKARQVAVYHRDLLSNC